MTTPFENSALNASPAPKKKITLLPLLTVLFVISYGLMTLLIVEQGRTIQSQSNLIKILLPESRELWGLRGKAVAQKNSSQDPPTQDQSPCVRTPSTQNPSSQIPSTQGPSTQVPPMQVPSTQTAPRHHSSGAGKSAKPETQLPPTPASDLLDQSRSLVTI
jgi:hypothetical protein